MPLTSQARPGPRRRSLLASLAGAALLTGCTDDGDDGARGAPSLSQEKRLNARAARESADLLGQYDQALAALPGLAARLDPLRAEIERHVEAFGGAARPSALAPSASTPPVAEKDVLKALAAAERALSDRRMTALADTATPAEHARLLASVAAAGAGHAYLLAER
ncbi:hypothetical protein OKJ48_42740 [Streptomyces kunmingensis]|uniref:Lipoprotein n=1 Tax=Streptomyces kunmingensis TaxID=68225 RepID=A0ABU6CQE9_9ACTN|nr:hypothetical protein [Streptomyces kunmingensis]MEB3966907.1 hypothetical protein [Streptomyces kunmingensis]